MHLEILLRMQDDDATILPGAFMAAAERFHLATRIDRWVFGQVIDWLTEHDDKRSPIAMVCVNLSGQSVGDRSFHEFATSLLSTVGQDICSKLCLEITETAAVTNLADASIFIENMNALGVSIALDDFGAGASSFGYIKNLAVDILKIDGQFIKDLVDDPLDDAAVRCFIDVARILNLKTVAEFVDSPRILKRVEELGVDFAQGFLLHKPEPLEQVIQANGVQAEEVSSAS